MVCQVFVSVLQYVTPEYDWEHSASLLQCYLFFPLQTPPLSPFPNHPPTHPLYDYKLLCRVGTSLPLMWVCQCMGVHRCVRPSLMHALACVASGISNGKLEYSLKSGLSYPGLLGNSVRPQFGWLVNFFIWIFSIETESAVTILISFKASSAHWTFRLMESCAKKMACCVFS